MAERNEEGRTGSIQVRRRGGSRWRIQRELHRSDQHKQSLEGVNRIDESELEEMWEGKNEWTNRSAE